MSIADIKRLITKYGGDCSLNDIYCKLRNKRQHVCPKCNGHGMLNLTAKCNVCNGEGYTAEKMVPITVSYVAGYKKESADE